MEKRQSENVIRTKNKQLGRDRTSRFYVRHSVSAESTNNNYPSASGVRDSVHIAVPRLCLADHGKTKSGRVVTYIFGPNGLDCFSGGNVYDAPLIQGSTMFGDAWQAMLDGGPWTGPDEMKQTAEEALKLWR